VKAAAFERSQPLPPHLNNGDETTHLNRIGNYSKGLPHDQFGEVDPAAYNSLLQAVNTGQPADFQAITLGPSSTVSDDFF
jgi:hypothetical protein